MAHEPHASAADEVEKEIAAALDVLRRGGPEGMERLMPVVYVELRRVAHRQLGAEPAGHTLSTTGLVHEAYLRLADQKSADWVNRAQFFGLAAFVMRRVLVDYARRHRAVRRGGPARARCHSRKRRSRMRGRAGRRRSQRRAARARRGARAAGGLDPRLARVVECRFFGGLTEAETAEMLGVSLRTVAGDWMMAKGWLYRELRPASVSSGNRSGSAPDPSNDAYAGGSWSEVRAAAEAALSLPRGAAHLPGTGLRRRCRTTRRSRSTGERMRARRAVGVPRRCGGGFAAPLLSPPPARGGPDRGGGQSSDGTHRRPRARGGRQARWRPRSAPR